MMEYWNNGFWKNALLDFDFTRPIAVKVPKESSDYPPTPGLDIEAHESALAEWADRVQNTNNKKFVEAKTSRHYSRADHQTRIDRWKENLNFS